MKTRVHIFWGKNLLKFGAIADNFRLRSRISPERIGLSKIGNASHQLHLADVRRKKWWTLAH